MVEHLSDRQATTVVTSRLAEILDAVDSGVTVLNEDLRLVYVNQAAASLCGWSTPEEMLAASPSETLARFELLDEAGDPVSLAVLPGRRVLAGEDPEPMVFRFRVQATGEERWSIVRARAIEVGSGQRLAVTTFNDLTAQVQEGKASQASERRYREIVEALPVIAWFADPDGAMIAANARWIEYSGAMAEAGSLEDVEQVHEEERSELASRWRVAHEAIEPLEATVRLRRHDGEFRWHILRIVPLRGEAGTLQGWIGTATDIDDERRASLALLEAERQFRDLTDSAPMLVWMAGLDGEHTFFNRGWLEFTGRTLADEIEHGWIGAVHPADVERRQATLDDAFARQDRFEVEYRLRRHDGVYRWVLDIGAPRRGLDGEFLGFVGSCVDIEERKRASDIARLVADAGLRLDETRDLAETIQAAASLPVPDLADFCIIDLVEPDGSLRRVAAVAKDAAQQAILEGIRDFPTASDSPRPAARAVGERRPILLTDLEDPEILARHTADNQALAGIIRAMEAHSAIVQPLIARGETIGAMFFVVGPDREYGPAEIEITTELARRVAAGDLERPGPFGRAGRPPLGRGLGGADHAAAARHARPGGSYDARRGCLPRRPRRVAQPSARAAHWSPCARTTRSSSSQATAMTTRWSHRTRTRRCRRPRRWRARPASRSRSGFRTFKPRTLTTIGLGTPSSGRATARSARFPSSPTASRSGSSDSRSRNPGHLTRMIGRSSAPTLTSARRPSPVSR